MPENSQEDLTVVELTKEWKDFIEGFQAISVEAVLKQWEGANRKKIKGAPFQVKDLLDAHWKNVTGGSLFVTITEIDFQKLQQPTTGRIDPKSRHYKTERIFHIIHWKKTTLIIGKGIEREEKVSYQLSGVHTMAPPDWQDRKPVWERLIVNRCKPHRLIDHLGEEHAEKVLKNKKSVEKGTFVDVEIPILVEGHWEVSFAGRQNQWEKNYAEIQHEGLCLQMQREVPVILPGYFIEVNDNAKHPIFRKIGDQPRKIVGWVHHFPLTVLRESTWEEYRIAKEQGDKVAAAARAEEERGM